MTLDLLPESFAICRLPADAPVPSWTSTGAFSSITRTTGELSIVCAADRLPANVSAKRGYRGLAVRGPLDFALIGIVAELSRLLAAAAISIFVVSTYDTDVLFVSEGDLDRAVAALRSGGHTIVDDTGAATRPTTATNTPRGTDPIH